MFFVCNHQNYARWTDLSKVAETHPGLEEDFKNGFFLIKRTGNPFSRQPVDLTLEQTINTDAARKLTGIIHLTDSISARQRWTRSHDISSSIISHVLGQMGLSKEQDITADLQAHNIKKSSQQIDKFIKTFDQHLNPFSREFPKDQLFNIASCKAATSHVEEFLLNVEKIGCEQRELFLFGCSSDIYRFDKTIK